MRYVAVLGLLVFICTSSVVHGGTKGSPRKEDLLATEVMSKVVYRNSRIVAHAEECRLQIRFEGMNAVFDLPLRGTRVEEDGTADGILVMNKNMTRALRGGAPAPFERLTLRLRTGEVQSMMKTFQDAIAACSGKGQRVAEAN